MVITKKEELEKVACYLKGKANELTAPDLRAAFLNVGFVLEQALKELEEDASHPHLTLRIVKQPNLLDRAVEHCCNTFCTKYSDGLCPYPLKGKLDCPVIRNYLDDNGEE